MKRILISIFISISIFQAFPQGIVHTLSLNNAVILGIGNRFDVKAGRLNKGMAEIKIKKAKLEWMPVLNATGNIRYNMQLQATLIPAGYVGFTEPTLLVLGATNVSIFGFEITQPLFRPGINTDIRLAKKNAEMNDEKERQFERDVRIQITKAYLDVLLRKFQYQLAIADEQRFRDYMELSYAKLNQGTILETEYKRAVLDHENAILTVTKSYDQYTIAISYLKYQLNIPYNDSIELADSLTSGIISGQLINPPSQIERTEIRQLRMQLQVDNLTIRKSKQAALPSVSLFGNYSEQFLSDRFDYTTWKWWTPFSYAGISISIPITGNFKNSEDILERKLLRDQTALRLEQEKSDVTFDLLRARTDLNSAIGSMQIARNNYDRSINLYNIQKNQYEYGSFPYSSLLDSERTLSQIEAAYLKSAYDLLNARINYLKAVGTE